jgi:hypothetical protein
LAIGISIYDSLLSMFEQQEAAGNLVTLEYDILDGCSIYYLVKRRRKPIIYSI